MVLVTINKPKSLVLITFVGDVTPEDLERDRDDLPGLLAEMPPDFRLLTDMERLTSMDRACQTELGRVMEMCDEKDVGLVVRVVPDPRKDIGLNILTRFHYKRRVRVVTCETMEEAAKVLGL